MAESFILVGITLHQEDGSSIQRLWRVTDDAAEHVAAGLGDDYTETILTPEQMVVVGHIADAAPVYRHGDA